MSWDLYLYLGNHVEDCDERGDCLFAANYTHNVNGMIAAALEAAGEGETEDCDGPLGKVIGKAWWRRMDGIDGPAGAKLLYSIVTELDSDAARYDLMNPANGWGSRESLVHTLRSILSGVPEELCHWHAYG